MTPQKHKKVALVGGAGFIGHNLALKLKSLGHEPHIIDGLEVNNFLAFTSSDTQIPNREFYLDILDQRFSLLKENHIPIHVQDARDRHELSDLLESLKPDIIVFLPAVSHAEKSNETPFLTYDHSFRTLQNTLEYARGRVEHFIFFSSSMVYGHFHSGTVKEDDICSPLGIYGTLKFAGEKLVIAYKQVFDLPYTIIRPSALYGPRCVSRRVLQIFLENILQQKELTIKGDGSDRLDFTYISDLVNGVVKVIESEKSKNETFNLTYGESRSMSDVTNILNTHFSDLKVNYIPKDKLMPDRGTLSVEKAKSLISYCPEYPLERGLKEYHDWYSSVWNRLSQFTDVKENKVIDFPKKAANFS